MEQLRKSNKRVRDNGKNYSMTRMRSMSNIICNDKDANKISVYVNKRCEQLKERKNMSRRVLNCGRPSVSETCKKSD